MLKDLYDTSPIIEYKIELFQCVASRLGKIKARSQVWRKGWNVWEKQCTAISHQNTQGDRKQRGSENVRSFHRFFKKKKTTFQIYRLSDAKQSNHESNATSVKELLRIVSEANGHLTPDLWVWSWSFLHLQQKALYWHQSRRVFVKVLNIYNETWLYETRTLVP